MVNISLEDLWRIYNFYIYARNTYHDVKFGYRIVYVLYYTTNYLLTVGNNTKKIECKKINTCNNIDDEWVIV